MADRRKHGAPPDSTFHRVLQNRKFLKIEGGSDFLLPARICTGSNKRAKKYNRGKRPWSVGWLYRCAAVVLLAVQRSPFDAAKYSTYFISALHTCALGMAFFFTVPLASEVVLNGGRAGASGPRPSGALVRSTIHTRVVPLNID